MVENKVLLAYEKYLPGSAIYFTFGNLFFGKCVIKEFFIISENDSKEGILYGSQNLTEDPII